MNYVLVSSEWLDRVENYLSSIAEYIRGQTAEFQKKLYCRPLTNEEVMEFLSISKRTLQRMRSDGRISYTIIEGQCRYTLEDLWECINSGHVKRSPTTREEFERNYRIFVQSKKRKR